MKKILLTVCLSALASSALFAQVYSTRNGKISFNATAAKSPEKIEAINNEVAAGIDASAHSLRFVVLIKSFKFERDLMQKHFNENYMQSDKYPKAEFKGELPADVKLDKDGTYNTKVSGKLTIHGVTKDVSVPGTITVKGGSANLKTKFNVVLADYNIEVPSVVSDKVGKEAVIAVDCNLAK